jgi:hypothetical protein
MTQKEINQLNKRLDRVEEKSREIDIRMASMSEFCERYCEEQIGINNDIISINKRMIKDMGFDGQLTKDDKQLIKDSKENIKKLEKENEELKELRGKF